MGNLIHNPAAKIAKEWASSLPTRIAITKDRGISIFAETTMMAEDGTVNFVDVVETPGEPYEVRPKSPGNREIKPGWF